MKKTLLTIILFTMSVTLDARVSCKQFNHWEEAQAYYKAKKPGYKSLDQNHDGQACNQLKRSGDRKHRIKIYQYGSPAGFGQILANKNACEKKAAKLNKQNKGLNLSYRCEEL